MVCCFSETNELGEEEGFCETEVFAIAEFTEDGPGGFESSALDEDSVEV